MQTLSLLSLTLIITAVSAFMAPLTFGRPTKMLIQQQQQRPVVRITRVASTAGAPEEEEQGLDLDLGEMFEMFDAADKDEDFDEAIKKVKTEEESK